MSEFTLILEQARNGDASAAPRLLPLVYNELRRLAAAKLSREAAAHTLQPTALVHEAWLRLGGTEQPSWDNRRHFLAAAAEAMRRILVEKARSRAAVRHGGGLRRVDLDEAAALPLDSLDAERVLAVSEALGRFAAVAPDHAELVQLRYYVGLGFDEAAATLGISVPTAKRRWAYARAWLHRELAAPTAP